jgi:tight adherence protein C
MSSTQTTIVDSEAMPDTVVDSGVTRAQLFLLNRIVLPSYRRQLVSAGITENNAQATFVVLHAMAMSVGALAAVWVVASTQPTLTVWLPAVMIGSMAGWWIPRSWLQWKQTQRRIEITTDFPVMLDLLQISIQGGMGLPAAWDVVTANLAGTGDPLAREMRRVALEINLGTTWAFSLNAASERTGVSEFRVLGSLLQQTERFGTELTKTLQVLSDSLRNEEIESLEERAHRAAVLMLLPISMLLLPATLLLIAAPLLTMVLETIEGANPN